jgi:hypothetical protein
MYGQQPIAWALPDAHNWRIWPSKPIDQRPGRPHEIGREDVAARFTEERLRMVIGRSSRSSR